MLKLNTFFVPTEPTGWVFLVLIFGIFLYALFATVRQYRKRSAEIKQLQTKLEGFHQIRTEAEIFRLEKAIQGISLIEVPWWEFRAALIQRGDSIFSKGSFHDFFHLDSLEPHRILTPRVAASIPSTLTILGILGTFISLVIGLAELNLKNLSEKEILLLVGNVKTAYIKSVWGVGCSVIFSFVDRGISDHLRWQVEKTATLFDRLFAPESSESWLAQILTQQEQQTAALKAFNTDLSNQLRQANSQVIDALGSFGGQVTSVFNKTAKSQEDTLKVVLEEVVRIFRDQMISAVKASMGELVESLNLVTKRLENFGGEAARMATELGKVTGDLSETQKDLGAATSVIEDTLLTMNETLSVAQRVSGDNKDTITYLIERQKNVADIIDKFDDVAQKIQNASLSLERSELAKTLDAVSQRMTKFGSSAEDMTKSMESVTTGLNDTQRGLHATVSRMDGTLSFFADSIGAAQELAELNVGTVKELSEHQKTTAKTMAMLEAVASRVAQATASLEQCQKETDFTTNKIIAAIGTLDENLMEFTGRFDTVNMTLSQTATEFAASVRSEVEKYCVTLDNSLSSAALSLRTAVKEIEDVLPNASSSLSTGVKSMEDALRKLETSMARLKLDEGALREATGLIATLKAWELAQKQAGDQ